jgi:mycofactocin precursor peptide peptidase
VRLAAARPGNTAALAELLPTLLRGGVAAASPNGVLGDPGGADAESGSEILEAMVGRLRDALARWTPDTSGRLL